MGGWGRKTGPAAWAAVPDAYRRDATAVDGRMLIPCGGCINRERPCSTTDCVVTTACRNMRQPLDFSRKCLAGSLQSALPHNTNVPHRDLNYVVTYLTGSNSDMIGRCPGRVALRNTGMNLVHLILGEATERTADAEQDAVPPPHSLKD